jgi:hypothetical protein
VSRLPGHDVCFWDQGAKRMTPEVGQRYIATNNAEAMQCLCGRGYPVPGGAIFVTVERVYPVQEKVQVRPDGLWLNFGELAAWFRPVNPSYENQKTEET